jgi:hypothetical protein
LFGFIIKYFNTIHPGLCESFATDIIHFLQSKLHTQKTHISTIKVYYNNKTISCIVRVKFDNQYVKELPDDYFYFFINCYQRDITIYGQKLQESLSVKENCIIWIHENNVLTYYPERGIMDNLSKQWE